MTKFTIEDLRDIAGALILAEIERIDRAAAGKGEAS